MKSFWFSIVALGLFANTNGAKLTAKHLPSLNEDGGKLWVLLAAGSDTYFNYRHQSDICHAYQIVHNHGVPDEKVVVFMRDDVANSPQNPNQGSIINEPHGPNVYPGVPKDYTGKNLDLNLFLRALQGQDNGGKKVIKSGPEDTVFVYFADHGAPGISEFGSGFLNATALLKAIRSMRANNQFKRMILYWESCESGSMFEDLEPNLNVIALSAANSTQSSYACDYVKDLKTFVNDCFSMNWMEDVDAVGDLSQKTLEEDFKLVRQETNESHVKMWGDKTLRNLPLSAFLGAKKTKPYVPPQRDSSTAVESHEVPLAILKHRLADATSHEERLQLAKEIEDMVHKRKGMSDTIDEIIDQATNHMLTDGGDTKAYGRPYLDEVTMENCYLPIVDQLTARCFTVGCNQYLTKNLDQFASWCKNGFNGNYVFTAINEVCKNGPVCGIH